MVVAIGVFADCLGHDRTVVSVAIGEENIAKLKRGVYYAGLGGDIDLDRVVITEIEFSLPKEARMPTKLLVVEGHENGDNQWLTLNQQEVVSV